MYSDEQLKEIEKADFLQSFDLKFKGLAALFWNKVHAGDWYAFFCTVVVLMTVETGQKMLHCAEQIISSFLCIHVGTQQHKQCLCTNLNRDCVNSQHL